MSDKTKETPKGPFADSKIYNDPNQYWEVTTEGDCEGRTVIHLGVYRGLFYEIALHLADKCYYMLTFRNVDIPDVLKPTGNSVCVGFDINSGFWDFSPSTRADFISEKVDKNAPVTITKANTYAGFMVELKKKKSKDDFIREQALSKLTEKERKVLGL